MAGCGGVAGEAAREEVAFVARVETRLRAQRSGIRKSPLFLLERLKEGVLGPPDPTPLDIQGVMTINNVPLWTYCLSFYQYFVQSRHSQLTPKSGCASVKEPFILAVSYPDFPIPSGAIVNKSGCSIEHQELEHRYQSRARNVSWSHIKLSSRPHKMAQRHPPVQTRGYDMSRLGPTRRAILRHVEPLPRRPIHPTRSGWGHHMSSDMAALCR
jgi:hypothetical protein